MTDADSHRLPQSTRPTRYRLTLDVDLDAARFEGTVDVDLDVTESTDTIECHALGLEVSTVAVDGVDASRFSLDVADQRLVVELDRDLKIGRSHMTVRFAGTINDRLVGFYRSTYSDDAGTHTLGVTQFEAPHARQCFPCWDEPDRKATFDITLVVDPTLLAVSNGAELSRTQVESGKVAIRFAETMPMSTYLVAFVVGRLEATEPVVVDGTAVRVIHRPGQGHLCDAAIEAAAHSLRWFSDYYGIPYPGDKLDLVAVPDFAFGAMENLGCITFREVLLILDPETLTRPEMERAVTVIAHEIAHMWFGDLVTMRWWDGIWLNEAFATFMELSCTDAFRPDWHVWQTFGLGRSTAFDADAVGSTRPIHYEVLTPEDAEGMFDVLTYEKGCAVLRMVERHLGPDAFRDGVREYLARHSYGNTEMKDLWEALESVTDGPIVPLMDSWILQGGHPLVTATATDRGVRLEQRPFSYAGADPVPPARWSIPMRLRAGSHDGAFESVVSARVLLDGEAIELDLDGRPDWVCLNADATGFYRSNVDRELRTAMIGSIQKLSSSERFGLVDDSWALLLADELRFADIIELLRAVGGDDDPTVWRRVAGIVATIGRLAGDEHRSAASKLARELATPRIARCRYPELLGVLIGVAGGPGADSETITMARGIVARSEDGANPPHPELLAASIDVVATHGTPADHDRFLAMFRSAPTLQDEQRYLGALTRFDDPELFGRTLELCVSEVRSQNAPYTLGQAMANPRNGTSAWTFVRDRWDELTTRFPSNSVVRMAGGVRSLFDPVAATDVLAFFEQHPVPQGARSLAQHLDMVRTHQALRNRELSSLAETLA